MTEKAQEASTRRPLCPQLLKTAEASIFTQELSAEERGQLLDELECPMPCGGPTRVPYDVLGGKVLLRLNVGKDICTYVRNAIPQQSVASPALVEVPAELPR